MIHVQPPQAWPAAGGYKVFLAGSIEQDRAERWQDRVVEAMADTPVVLLNPRRNSWDSGLRQSQDEPVFKEQVEWELAGLEAADTILMYFDPTTLSPVSLLELGLHAHGGKLIVCCPEGFWRRGNVMITCERYQIPFAQDLTEMITQLRLRLA